MGGWGLKNPLCFAKALAAKGIWRIIKGVGLWEKVITHKIKASHYRRKDSEKGQNHQNGSCMWKDAVQAFSLVGDWLAHVSVLL